MTETRSRVRRRRAWFTTKASLPNVKLGDRLIAVGLPSDSRVVRARNSEATRDAFDIVVESEAFDLVSLDAILPRLDGDYDDLAIVPERRHKVFAVRATDVWRAIRGLMLLSTVVDLPVDATLLRAAYSIESDSFELLVESAEFDPVTPELRAPPYRGLWCYPPENK